MISIDLSGKTILITGAMGAIAEHMVKRLAGCRGDAGSHRHQDRRNKPGRCSTIGGFRLRSYLYFAADITDSSQVNRVVHAAFEKFPGMDTVIGHAGGCGLHPFASTSEADYERIFRFNYFAQTYLARAVLARWMQSQDRRPSDLYLFLCSANAAHADLLPTPRRKRRWKTLPAAWHSSMH